MDLLDARLRRCADFVRPGTALCDVGCDHGYLPCQLALEGKIRSGLACDVNPSPLDSAKRTIARTGTGGVVSTRLSDGLMQVRPEEARDIVIAGMGGELILSILLAVPWVKQPGRRLILQPMTKAELLRRGLCREGFRILEESAVPDGSRCYAVLLAEYDGVVRDCSPLYAAVGEMKDDVYLAMQQQRCRRKAQGLRQGGDPQAQAVQQLAEEIKQRRSAVQSEENHDCKTDL